MNAKEWSQNYSTIKKSSRQYAHFDYRINMTQAFPYVSNPENITHHGFYPFIHYSKDMSSYNKVSGKNDKKRDICYAAHIDSCIYQYYCFLLNGKYNDRIRRDGISNVPVAYRTDLGVSNIQLAKKAFDFIREHNHCYVMIGDFTGFFDNLDHNALKKQWCNLLEVERLPDDHYAIFKNITQYSKVELSDLLMFNHLDNTRSGRRKLNNKKRIISLDEFRKNRKLIKKNPNTYGIPQGSPISALLANIYMLDIDKQISNYIGNQKGLYMRYSDDFIIIVPDSADCAARSLFDSVLEMFNSAPGLMLKHEKSQFFEVHIPEIKIIGSATNCKHKYINFLGFTFDGNKVSIRAKTTGKYYYRMNRKAKVIARNGGYSPKGNHINLRDLYELYSKCGAHSKKGNFFTYVNRATKEFGMDELIQADTAHHMDKIKKALKTTATK